MAVSDVELSTDPTSAAGASLLDELPKEKLEVISNNIINNVSAVCRVLYDITSKPPGTIEWE